MKKLSGTVSKINLNNVFHSQLAPDVDKHYKKIKIF